MYEASLAVDSSMRKWARRRKALAESQFPVIRWKQGTGAICSGQFNDVAVVVVNRIPPGVELGPKTNKGVLSEPGNPTGASFGKTKVTGERSSGGRSLRSSLRAGKPSTWRRETVNTVSRQEGDITCPSR